MGAVVALDTLFNGGQVWKGRPAPPTVSPQPTGHAALDAALPTGGWPEAALTEILLAGQGVGELQLPERRHCSAAHSASRSLAWMIDNWRRSTPAFCQACGYGTYGGATSTMRSPAADNRASAGHTLSLIHI